MIKSVFNKVIQCLLETLNKQTHKLLLAVILYQLSANTKYFYNM